MRTVVNVATGSHYRKGQERLVEVLARDGENYRIWNDSTGLPIGSPTHAQCNYSFKAHAMRAASRDYTTLLWCDASIVPIKPLDELWERIERDGYWVMRGGWTNYEWTADDAYMWLFEFGDHPKGSLKAGIVPLEATRAINKTIPHAHSGAFGVSMKHPIGRALLEEFCRLGIETRAFHGPWRNSNASHPVNADERRAAPCGPPDVLGHRHDQTALSVVAWRLGCHFTAAPEIFAYGKWSDPHDERTILVTDGGY